MRVFICILLVIVLGIFAFSAGELYGENRVNVPVNESALVEVRESEDVIIAPEDITQVIEKTMPTVVGIAAEQPHEKSSASGVIVSKKGYIVTSSSAIGDPERIDVTFYDGSERRGDVVWRDNALDIAIIMVEGNISAAADLDGSNEIKMGESVVVLGCPLGMQFERCAAQGIVSAKDVMMKIENEDTAYYMDALLQTDAAVNEESFGAPLFNMYAELIGITTGRAGKEAGGCCAVPVNILSGVVKALEERGEFETPYIGLEGIPAKAAKYLKKKGGESSGLYVMSLDNEGPGYAAGLRYGDIIKTVNGKSVNTMAALKRELFEKGVGEELQIEITRNGEIKTFSVTSAAAEEDGGENR